MEHLLVVFGTRPEAIKMAPVVRALRSKTDRFRTVVATTGQHRQMLDQVLAAFSLVPDLDLDLMRPGQGPLDVLARTVERLPTVLRDARSTRTIVQGDTTTAMAAALASFHEHVPVGHVEAGLRSGRLDSPFPEELNRVVIDRLADRLWPPTPGAAQTLATEQAAGAQVLVTGNTAIDALLDLRARLDDIEVPSRDKFARYERLVLATIHRRESFGAPLESLLAALDRLAVEFPHVQFVLPVHPNPNVSAAVHRRPARANVHRVDPLPYPDLVWLLGRAEFAMTDSGGIQEEAPALGTPVLILREVTERPEVVTGGAGLLVGTDTERVVQAARRWLADPEARAPFARPRLLFGDGRAAERIADSLAGLPVQPWVPAEVPR